MSDAPIIHKRAVFKHGPRTYTTILCEFATAWPPVEGKLTTTADGLVTCPKCREYQPLKFDKDVSGTRTATGLSMLNNHWKKR